MRPYTGIGLLVFSQTEYLRNEELPLLMYEEPGLARIGVLTDPGLSGNEWIFGSSGKSAPLIVSARKGEWLRVFYDDAGREAWIEPQQRGRFESWEQFLKLRFGRMLPGLQPQYYQVLQRPGGKLIATLSPKQQFKVLKVEASWGMVLIDQAQLGWVRWQDVDGRLTIGAGK